MKFDMRFKDLTIVDLDGTLLNYRKRAFRTFCIVAGTEAVKNYTFMDFVVDRLSGLTNYQIYNSLSSPSLDIISFDAQIVDTIEVKELLKLDEIFSDAIPWLNIVGSTSNILICTSRKNELNLEWQLSRLDLSHINYLRVPNAVEKGREIQVFLHNINIELSRIRFVGDTSYDMIAGKSIGADLYFVERGLNSRDTLDPSIECNVTAALPLFKD